MPANRTYKLLEANTTAIPGPWAPFADFVDPPALQIEGMIATDIVQIEGSNDEGVKAAIVNIEQIGADVTADGLFNLDAEARTKWIRANRTVIAGGGSVTILLSGTIHT